MRFQYPISNGYARRAYRPAYRAAAPVTVDFTDARWTSFKEVQPTIAGWIEAKASSFDFAASLFGAVLRHGDLTANQYDAVERCIQRDKARDAQRAAAPTAPAADDTVDQTTIREVLRTRRKVTIAGFSFSLASSAGRNPHAIYVKDAGQYVGKVLLGGTRFLAGRDFDPARLPTLKAIFADPGEAVRADAAERARILAAHAARQAEQAAAGLPVEAPITVPCGCCGRTLSDPVSILRGIGPICAGQWGF